MKEKDEDSKMIKNPYSIHSSNFTHKINHIFSITTVLIIILSLITLSLSPIVISEKPDTLQTKNSSDEKTADTPAADVVANTPSADNPATDNKADTPSADIIDNTPAADIVANTPAAADNPATDNTADTPAVVDIVTNTPAADKPSQYIKINTKFKEIEINKTSNSNIEIKMESDLGNITNDKVISVQTEDENTKMIIKQIDFITNTNQENVKLSVSSLQNKPEEIIVDMNLTNSSKVYGYLDIKLTADDQYIGENGISSMTFTFTVEKTWIKNQSMDKNTIRIMRYHNDTWQILNTTYINETESAIYYSAMTPGLSIFAVVGDAIIEDSGKIVDDSNIAPSWMMMSVLIISSLILCVVLVKKRFIYKE